MRHIVILLGVIFCLSLSVPAWAGMADCDGPTTPEETENRQMLDFVDGMGTSPLHSAAAALLRGCEAMKRKFNAALSALGASRSSPPTDAQIDEALNAATSAPRNVASQTTPRAMSRNVAVIERNRIADMDAKAESLVQSNCSGFGCGSVLDNMVTPVIREVEKLNADPEYLAQMPRYAPIAAVEAAARFGWTRENGFWVNSGAQQRQPAAAANSNTLGNYLLSVDECKKLRDRLAKEIMAAPTKEPVELSFFEAECLPQLPDDRAAVAAWRSGFRITGGIAEVAPDSGAAQTARNETPVVPEESLSQWNTGLITEERQYQAAIEEKRKAAIAAEEAAQKAEEEKHKAESVASAKANSGRASSSGAGKYETICDRDDAKLQERVHESGLKFYASGYGTYRLSKLTVERSQRCKDASRIQKNHYLDEMDVIQKFERECGGRRQDNRDECGMKEEDQKFIDFLSREQNVMLRDPSYSASLGNIGGVARGSPQCEQARAELDEKNRYFRNNPDTSGSMVVAAQRGMFMAAEAIRVIKTLCADNPGYMSEIDGIEAGYKGLEKMCRQISGDPGACRPVMN